MNDFIVKDPKMKTFVTSIPIEIPDLGIIPAGTRFVGELDYFHAVLDNNPTENNTENLFPADVQAGFGLPVDSDEFTGTVAEGFRATQKRLSTEKLMDITTGTAADVSLSFSGVNLSLYNKLLIYVFPGTFSAAFGYPRARINNDSSTGAYLNSSALGTQFMLGSGQVEFSSSFRLEVFRSGTQGGVFLLGTSTAGVLVGGYKGAKFDAINSIQILNDIGQAERIPAGTRIMVYGVKR